MSWWQALIVALTTYAITKLVDLAISVISERREFKKFRREKCYLEIEDLKKQVGILVELAWNWRSFDEKQATYISSFDKDHELIGKYSQYPELANSARDTIHWCRIVASGELKHSDDLVENKNELRQKFDVFIKICDTYVERLI